MININGTTLRIITVGIGVILSTELFATELCERFKQRTSSLFASKLDTFNSGDSQNGKPLHDAYWHVLNRNDTLEDDCKADRTEILVNNRSHVKWNIVGYTAKNGHILPTLTTLDGYIDSYSSNMFSMMRCLKATSVPDGIIDIDMATDHDQFDSSAMLRLRWHSQPTQQIEATYLNASKDSQVIVFRDIVRVYKDEASRNKYRLVVFYIVDSSPMFIPRALAETRRGTEFSTEQNRTRASTYLYSSTYVPVSTRFMGAGKYGRILIAKRVNEDRQIAAAISDYRERQSTFISATDSMSSY